MSRPRRYSETTGDMKGPLEGCNHESKVRSVDMIVFFSSHFESCIDKGVEEVDLTRGGFASSLKVKWEEQRVYTKELLHTLTLKHWLSDEGRENHNGEVVGSDEIEGLLQLEHQAG